jgi:hypothetical protein
MDKVKKSINPEVYMQSSQPFKIYLLLLMILLLNKNVKLASEQYRCVMCNII